MDAVIDWELRYVPDTLKPKVHGLAAKTNMNTWAIKAAGWASHDAIPILYFLTKHPHFSAMASVAASSSRSRRAVAIVWPCLVLMGSYDAQGHRIQKALIKNSLSSLWLVCKCVNHGKTYGWLPWEALSKVVEEFSLFSMVLVTAVPHRIFFTLLKSDLDPCPINDCEKLIRQC